MPHFELVPDGHAVNTELYCEQMDRIYDKLKEKYPTLIRRKLALFPQDNAKPHTSKTTKKKFDELEDIEIWPAVLRLEAGRLIFQSNLDVCRFVENGC